MPKNLGLYNNDLSVPRKKDVDTCYSPDNAPPYPVTSVNTKTGDIELTASDVDAVATSDITQTLGTSTTKIPSEKAVSDAITTAGQGNMLKSTYDSNGNVANVGGIAAYVEVNGGKIDAIQVNNETQTITDKTVNIAVPTNNNQLANGAGYITASEAPVTSVNGQTGDVTVEADIPDNLVRYTAITAVQTVDEIDADMLQGHNATYFATATELLSANSKITANTNNISALQTDKVNKTGDTMKGMLIAQSNTNYTTAQVRNVIISTEEPSGGNPGDIWIKYSQ